MPTAISSALADAIAAVAAAWTDYDDAVQVLAGPRPDPRALQVASARLRSQMPDFDPQLGALPWQADPELDPEPPQGPPWTGSAFEVIYEMHVLRRAMCVTNQAHHLLALASAIGDLSSWHPQYDGERGEIVSSDES
jgi:hypothetical protein